MKVKKRLARDLFMGLTSERMGAMRADRKLNLKQSLVGRDAPGVAAPAQFTANLRELARPERDGHGLAVVALGLVVGVIRGFDAGSDEPTLGELVLAGKKPAARRLLAAGLLRLIAPAPKELAAHRGGT